MDDGVHFTMGARRVDAAPQTCIVLPRMPEGVTADCRNWPNGQSDREATALERLCNMMRENDVWPEADGAREPDDDLS